MRPLVKQPQSLAYPRRRPGFVGGLGAVFDGFGFLARTPGLWPLALVPIIVAVSLTGALGWLAITLLPGWIEQAMGPSTGLAWGLLTKLAELLATLLAAFVAVLLGFGLAQPLSGPALERIVRRAEADLGAPARPNVSVLLDVARSIQSVLISYAIGVPLLGVLFVIGFFFPPATIVTIPVKLAVTAMMIAWDLCDYPMSLRGVPVGARLAFVMRNMTAIFGFGCAIALLSAMTCGVVTLPVGVAGAARLLLSIERWEEHSRPLHK